MVYRHLRIDAQLAISGLAGRPQYLLEHWLARINRTRAHRDRSKQDEAPIQIIDAQRAAPDTIDVFFSSQDDDLILQTLRDPDLILGEKANQFDVLTRLSTMTGNHKENRPAQDGIG